MAFNKKPYKGRYSGNSGHNPFRNPQPGFGGGVYGGGTHKSAGGGNKSGGCRLLALLILSLPTVLGVIGVWQLLT